MILYRFISTFFLPLWIIFILYRLLRGKEELRRISERFAILKSLRSPNSKIIWIHAASVGESLVMLTLVNALAVKYTNHIFLLTTGTVTSAEIVQKRLPPKAIHQFIPIDEYFCIKRFFKYWRPDIGIIVESEIWPNLIDLGSKTCPMILVNATMSDRSYNRWQIFSGVARRILNKFSAILCQNEKIAEKYRSLSDVSEIKSCGNIKFSATQPSFDEVVLRKVKEEIGDRVVIIAVSTHPGDEEIICLLHNEIKNTYSSLLTIIVPRHPNRIDEISKLLYDKNIKFTTRTKGEDLSSDIYIADTLGELGLFFNVAKITIVCGSFRNGGHNIIEPAFFDTSILFGPDMRNSEDIAREFVKAKAAIQVSDSDDLIVAVKNILSGNIDELLMQNNAKLLLKKYRHIIDNYQNIIERYIA